MSLTVFDLEVGMNIGERIVVKDCLPGGDGKKQHKVVSVGPLISSIHDDSYWYQDYMRCQECRKHLDPDVITIQFSESILIPCYHCETLSRRLLGFY